MHNINSALIVEDDLLLSDAYKKIVSHHGFNVSNVSTIEQAHKAFDLIKPNIVLLDLNLPDGNGLDFYKQHADSENTKFVMITGHADVETAISSIRSGISEFLEKPVTLDKLKSVLAKLKTEIEDQQEITLAKSQACESFICNSQAMQNIKSQINKIASTSISVLLQGESGTGKEVVAEFIHKNSLRAGSFVPVNCGSIPAELITSELFGHVKGSFTGAHKNHNGYFEQAQGGTLFLDEITEMPISDQVHLLRVLESRKIKKVGGTKFIDIDVRIISATNRDLLEAVAQGKLREDLYYRLAQYSMELPRLIDRGDDITVLAGLFLSQFNQSYSQQKYFSQDYLEMLKRYSWPGNVRQLKNAILKSYVLSDQCIQACVLDINPHQVTKTTQVIDGLVGLKVIDVENELISSTLKQCDGNKPAAAKLLGISLKTLYNKLSYINQNTARNAIETL